MSNPERVPFWYIAAFAPLPIAAVSVLVLLMLSNQDNWWFGPSILVAGFVALFLCRVFYIGIRRYVASRE